MAYVKISNPGIAPVESFTVLGASTSRGTDKIGQFGTGNKQSITMLLRKGIPFTVFLGMDELSFALIPFEMKGKQFSRLTYTYKGVTKELDRVVEHGELDWTGIHMALREFISNAIDESSWKETKIEYSDDCSPVEGRTTICIEANDEIVNYIRNIEEYFLHSKGLEKEVILNKSFPSPPKIYRRGVFIRQLQAPNSLFDYNIDMEIDESRNSADATCIKAIANIICKDENALEVLFSSWKSSDRNNFESKIPHYFILSNRPEYKKAWNTVIGEGVFCAHEEYVINVVRNRGYRCQEVPYDWYSDLKGSGIKVASMQLSVAEANGATTYMPDGNSLRILNRLWNKLVSLRMTAGKKPPKLMLFTPVNDAAQGYWQDDTIYVSQFYSAAENVYLHELAHYVTGSSDYTPKYQEWLCNVATLAMREQC